MSNTNDEPTPNPIDKVAGAGTTDKIQGKLNEGVGHVKKKVGEATDNDHLTAEGEVQEGHGKAQQVVGHVKEAAETVADAVVEGAHKVGEAIKHALHKD